MPYITTNHRFIIDDKHPTDVFDEMENFFSLYTVAIDDLQQVSVQLSVPSNFDVTANKTLAEGYRQFVKSLKYTIPDINILPINTQTAQTDEEGELNDGNTVILLIQRLDGYDIDAEEKPSLYQSVLGKLMPRFGGDKTDTGLYPERAQIAIPEPLPTPPRQAPQVLPQTPIPQYQQPPSPYPPQPPQPYTPPVANVPTSTVQSTFQPKATVPAPKPATQPASRSIERLPNIAKSAKPYQDILTQAIVNEAKKLLDQSQPIKQITLKSSDSLTTATIEQLFNSFHHAHEANSPHDAIDLVSYGYEILKPQLAKIGVQLADDAGFGLKTPAKSTPADIARLQSGGVFTNEINLKVKLLGNQPPPNRGATPQAAQPQTTVNNQTHNAVLSSADSSSLNQNLQGIALRLKISDQLGERQQTISHFPVQFVSGDSPSLSQHIRLFGMAQNQMGKGFGTMVELDGQVLIDGMTLPIRRNGQVLHNGDVLLPNDVLSFEPHRQANAQPAITVQLLVPS